MQTVLQCKSQKIAAALSNVFVPGAGLVLLGRWPWALVIQALLVGCVLLLCWSRAVFERWAILLFLAAVVIIYLLSIALYCGFKTHTKHKVTTRAIKAGIFCLVSLTAMATGFITKQHWLGVQIYFVPSISMYPTLEAGDYILVDTWAYRTHTPQLQDIVVFEHGVRKQHIVKRIQPWPTGDTTKKQLWYVMGDNHKHSEDSRYFGGIKTASILGKVECILIRKNTTTSVWLKPVN